MCAVVGVATFIVYARTLWFGLYWDDNHHARSWGFTEVLGTFAGPFDPLGIEPVYYRPLPVVSFGIDWLIWGNGTWGYHLTNVVLHIAVVVLLARVLYDFTASYLAAAAGALYFSLIPANAPTAVYISERSDALVALFVLLAVRCVQRHGDSLGRRGLIAIMLCFVGALMSKEVGISLAPLAMVVWLALPLVRGGDDHVGPSGGAPTSATSLRARLMAHRLWLPLVAGFVATAACYLVYRSLVLPTGTDVRKYGDSGPVQSWVSAMLWTAKGVAWELPARAFPVLLVILAATIAVAWLRRSDDNSRTLWLFALGGVWVALACAPLALLGRVEPRLLYLAEIGMAIMVAAAVRSTMLIWRNPPWRTARWGFVAVNAALAVLTVVSLVEAQNEFAPGSAKMLYGDCQVVLDPQVDKYPDHRLQEVRDRLRANGAVDAASISELCNGPAGG